MTIPDAKKVLAAIKEPGAYGGSPELWEEAMKAMPEGRLPFLDREHLPARLKAARLSEDHVEALAAVAAEVEKDAGLSAFAWYMHWRVFVTPEKGIPWGAPSLLERLAKQAGLFYQLLSLEWPPRLRAYHEKLGYPAEVTHDTLVQIPSYEENHKRGRGSPGIYENQFPWLATYISMPYMKLGRFEYQLHPYGGGVCLWRRAKDGAVLVLAEDGTRVGDDGLRPVGEESAWTASLKETDDAVTGFPVDPKGYYVKKEVRLPRPDWAPYLKKGETVLDLHIPAGGKMDWDSIVDSFKRAPEFFKKHHADQPWKALIVTTWFMDPRLSKILAEDSNPMLLQRASYLYPCWPDPDSLWFMFLCPMKGADPAKLPRDTSIQRKLAEFLEKGNTWHSGSFLILPEHVAEPKLDVYRQSYEKLKREL